MTQDQIIENLKEVIATVKPKLDCSGVNMETSLVRDLGMDSLSMLLMSLAIEQKFGLQFNTQTIFNTLGDVVNYIAKAI